MSDIEVVFSIPLAAALAAAAELVRASSSVGGLTDRDLLADQRGLAELNRSIGAYASAVAGEIGYRSRRELGHSGLAQRTGFNSPEALVQATSGSSARDAATLVHVGGLLNGESPWLAPVAAAVAAGDLSASAAQAISAGLGAPVDTEGRLVGADELAAAAQSLVDVRNLTVDELKRRARALRDEIDAAGVVEQERAIHEERALRRTRRPNGLSRYTIDPDIETAAFLDDLYDKLMAPRRGGPRFVNSDDRAWAESISADPRTPAQYLHDSITGLLRQAVGAGTTESRKIVGSRAPSVRVLVAGTSLASGDGVGHIEGQPLAISIRSVERIACAEGTIAIGFDETGQVINLGREQRLYNGAQRLALAARDGGCRFGDCSAPASWTEAHHINPWHRDGGKTDLADGILLCRFHHMLLHNNGWEVERRERAYWLIPPNDVDPGRTPRPMRSKSAALRDLLTG